MKIVYQVVEYGGEWESEWETVYYTCSSLELANKIVEDIEKERIFAESLEEIDLIYESINDWINDDKEGSLINALMDLYPQYSKENLEKVIKAYDNIGRNFTIREIKVNNLTREIKVIENENEYIS